MSIDRATIKIGPAMLSHDGVTRFFPDGLTLAVTKTFVDIEVDAFGVMLKALADVTMEVTGTPKQWLSLAKLNPFGGMAFGTLINGGADKPLVITPINGKPLTLAAAAVKTPPNLMLSASKPFFSSACTWCGVLANNTEWSDAGARYSYGADASGVALTGLTPALMALCPWAGSLGGTAFKHEDGIAISFSVQLDEQREDSQGLIDYSFGGVEVTVSYVPVGTDEEDNLDALGIQGAGILRGVSGVAADLAVTGSGTRAVSVKGLVQRSAAGRYNRKDKRVGAIELSSTRSVTTGVLNTLYTFTD
jgi:hypothetical protein